MTITTTPRLDAVLSLIRREAERRPWLETEAHLGTLIFMVRFDRQGTPHRCVVKTEGECDV